MVSCRFSLKPIHWIRPAIEFGSEGRVEPSDFGRIRIRGEEPPALAWRWRTTPTRFRGICINGGLWRFPIHGGSLKSSVFTIFHKWGYPKRALDGLFHGKSYWNDLKRMSWGHPWASPFYETSINALIEPFRVCLKLYRGMGLLRLADLSLLSWRTWWILRWYWVI